MREFLQALFESGHVSVPPAFQANETEDLTSTILDFDRASRVNLAGSAPKLDPAVAAWAATVLYRGCQLVVLRNLDAQLVAEVFQLPCPAPRSPETDYSADLFLRYLPDVLAMAKRLAAADPLVAQLEGLGSAWPLSFVVTPATTPGPTHSFVHHPSLRQLYIDRIIERKAIHLAKDPQIETQVRASYGAFPELCPEIDEALASPTVT